MTLLILPSLAGWFLIGNRLFGSRKELGLLSLVSAVTVLLYAAALAGVLEVVARALFWGGLAACLWLEVREGRETFRRDLRCWLVPGIAVYLVFATAHWLIFQEASFLYWDEFSHWGLAVKEILFRHGLYDGSGNVQFPHYPPGAPLWIYWVTVNTGFSEGAAYFAHALLLLAPVPLLFRRIRFRDWPRLACAVLLLLLVIANYGQGLANLQVDGILGLFLAGVVLAELADDLPGYKTLLLLPPLAVLPLLKESGVILAAAAVLFIVVRRALRAILLRRENLRRLVTIKRLVVGAALFLVPFLSAATWNAHLRHAGIHRAEEKNNPFAVFPAALLTGDLNERQAEVAGRFGDLLLHQQLSRTRELLRYNEFSYALRDKLDAPVRLSAVGWAICFALVAAAAFLLTRRRRQRVDIAVTACFLEVFLIGYSFLLFCMYVFIFSPSSSMRMASYVRYMGTAVLPVALLAGAFFLPVTQGAAAEDPARRNRRLAALTTLIFGLYTVERPYVVPLLQPNPAHEFRRRTAAAVQLIRQTVPEGKRLGIVFQVRENGFMRQMLRYDLAPIRVRFLPVDIADRPDEFHRRLESYDYLWLFAHRGALLEQVRDLMTGTLAADDALFRIQKKRGVLQVDPIRPKLRP